MNERLCYRIKTFIGVGWSTGQCPIIEHQVISALRFFLASTVILFGGIAVGAQSDDRNFEVGGQISFLRLPTRTADINTSGLSTEIDRKLVAGLGGRLGYNFSRFVALEGEVNLFPSDSNLEGGRKVQGVFGFKVGKRFEKVGIFAKARPGFAIYSKGSFDLIPGALCAAISPPPVTCASPSSRMNFAFDIGGVVELYPSKRTVVRFDAGDTMIFLGARNAAANQLPLSGTPGPARIVVVPASPETSHNFQMGVGFGLRF